MNGVAIALDPVSDSLQDVLDRISTSSAGVTASLDANGDRVAFASVDPTAALSLSDAGTGFFAALQIAEGTVEARTGGRSSSPQLRRSRDVSHQLNEISRSLREIFGERSAGAASDDLDAVRSELEKALRGSFARLDGLGSGEGTLRSGFGIDLTPSDRKGAILSFDTQRFERAARRDAVVLESFLFGDANSRGENAGLVPNLLAALEAAQQRVTTLLGQHSSSTGRRIDLFA